MFLHLMAHDQIFIPQLVIGTIVEGACQKTDHIVLIQVHVTHVAFILIVIYKIGAGLAVCYFLHGISPPKLQVILTIYDIFNDCKGVVPSKAPDFPIFVKNPGACKKMQVRGFNLI